MTPRDIKTKLEELPSTHSKEQILDMIEQLQYDVEQDKDLELSFSQKVHKHADKHKELFFSYPMLYRTVVKGTFRPVVLDILLDARQAMASGQKSKKDALEEVIRKSVDEVTAYRQNEKR